MTCCAISLHIPQTRQVASATTTVGEECARSSTTKANQHFYRSFLSHDSLLTCNAHIGGNASQSLDLGGEPRLHHQGTSLTCLRKELLSAVFHFVLCHTHATLSRRESRRRHFSAVFPLVGIDGKYGCEEEPAARCRPSVRHRVAIGSQNSCELDSSAMDTSCSEEGAPSLRDSCLAVSEKDTADAFPPRSLGGRRSAQGFFFNVKKSKHRGGNDFVGSGGTVHQIGRTGERDQARTAIRLWVKGPFRSGRADSERIDRNTLREHPVHRSIKAGGGGGKGIAALPLPKLAA